MMSFTPEFKAKVSQIAKNAIAAQNDADRFAEELRLMFTDKGGSFVVLHEDESFCWFVRIKGDTDEIEVEVVKSSRMF